MRGLGLLGLALLTLAAWGAWRLLGSSPLAASPSQEPWFIYSELEGSATTLWAARPQRLGEKRLLARLSHKAGYGIAPRLSGDGQRLAYTLLPPEAGDDGPTAQLWLLGLASGERRLLQEGVDLRSPPLWSPQGQRLLFRRSPVDRTELWLVDLETNTSGRLVQDDTAWGLYPFAWAPEGVYYARIAGQGTELMLAAINGEARPIAHLSDGIARDFALSPDAARIVHTAQGRDKSYSLAVLDLATGDIALMARGSNDHYGPIWHPQREAITYSPEAPQGLATLGLAAQDFSTVMASREGGFELPLAWSPDGRYLAVRSFQGASSRSISAERLAILSPETGARYIVEAKGYAQWVGWLPP